MDNARDEGGIGLPTPARRATFPSWRPRLGADVATVTEYPALGDRGIKGVGDKIAEPRPRAVTSMGCNARVPTLTGFLV